MLLRRTTLLDTDPLGIDGPALTILVPDGWTVQGGPVWRHQYSNLATYEGVEFFPPGSNYFGNDVRAPIRDAVVFLEQLVHPGYRGAFGARVIGCELLPEVVTLYAAGSLSSTEVIAERVLTEHTFSGVTMHEEFTVVLTFTPKPGISGASIWGPQQIFSTRAPADQFDEVRPVF